MQTNGWERKENRKEENEKGKGKERNGRDATTRNSTSMKRRFFRHYTARIWIAKGNNKTRKP